MLVLGEGRRGVYLSRCHLKHSSLPLPHTPQREAQQALAERPKCVPAGSLPPPRPARENTTLPRNPAGRRSRHGAPRPALRVPQGITVLVVFALSPLPSPAGPWRRSGLPLPGAPAAPRLRRWRGSARGRCVAGNGSGSEEAVSGGAGGFRVCRWGGRRGWGSGAAAAAAAAGERSVDGRRADGSGGICQVADVTRGVGDEPVRAEERGWGCSPAGAEPCLSRSSSSHRRRRRRLLSSSRSRRLRPPPRSGTDASSRAPAPTPNARRVFSSRPTGRRAAAASSARTAGNATTSGSCWQWRR